MRFNGRPGYDWFFPFESISEFNSEAEQSNVYDAQFALCGFDPERIPEKYKRPYWTITERDIEELGPWKNKSYIAFQMRATNIARTLPLHVVDLVLSVLDKVGMPILCLDDCELEAEVKTCIHDYKNVVDFSQQTPNLRQYGTLISHAQLVVGPDSSAIHFAAAAEVPCVSLWGAFDPDSRVRYYPNHIALWSGRAHCANSPCFNFRPELPYHKCPDGENQRHCAVIGAITQEEILGAIQKHGF
jgi:ADP-heptose:LPS heptosyltransferase